MIIDNAKPVLRLTPPATIFSGLVFLLAVAESSIAKSDDEPQIPAYIEYAQQEAQLGSPLDLQQLQNLRGGFTNTNGLHFAFGLERITRLNGDALSQVSVILPVFSLQGDITTNTFAQYNADTFSQINGLDAFNPASYSANSANTIFASSFTLPLIIQNNLDNQHIENLTSISLDIFGTDAFRGSTIYSLIEATSIQSLRP
ncbi:MAG: hypothetical protein ACK5ME_11825 [Parahaliea sp.]